MDLPGLAAHATAVAAVTPVLDYVAIIAIMQCVAKIVVVLGAGTVALVTNNQERRDACLKLVEIVWHNWDLAVPSAGIAGMTAGELTWHVAAPKAP